MIAPLIRASFRRPLLVMLIALAAAAAGTASLFNLRRDVFPDLTTPVFNVIVQNAAMAPEELEQGVAIPLETALSGLPDVRRLRSSSQAGVTQVTIEFEPDADYYRARQLVTERVAQAAAELPAGTDAPLVSSLTGRLNEILEFTLESDTESASASTPKPPAGSVSSPASGSASAPAPASGSASAPTSGPGAATGSASATTSAPTSASGSLPTSAPASVSTSPPTSAAALASTSVDDAASGRTDLMALRDLAEFDISRRLRSVPGVATVERLGGYRREFQVSLDPERLRARSVTLDEVLHAVDESNTNASGGYIVRGATEWSIRTIGRASTTRDLGATVVAVRGTVPVLLSDVSDVRELPAPRRGIAHRLKGEVVSCRVVKQFGADTVQVAANVRTALDEIQRGLPKGVRLRLVYDQSALVTSSLGGVGRAVMLGAVFVVIVLIVLMGDLRAALLVTITIPWSFAIAGLLLDRLNVGLNTMTLGGLAIAVGLLVDAAIIVTENIAHRLRRAPAPPCPPLPSQEHDGRGGIEEAASTRWKAPSIEDQVQRCDAQGDAAAVSGEGKVRQNDAHLQGRTAKARSYSPLPRGSRAWSESADATVVARARDAAIEVGRPIAFATVIVIAVFSPLLATSGIEGRMYRPLAVAVLATLASALVLSLTVVPIAAARLLRPRRSRGAERRGNERLRERKRVLRVEGGAHGDASGDRLSTDQGAPAGRPREDAPPPYAPPSALPHGGAEGGRGGEGEAPALDQANEAADAPWVIRQVTRVYTPALDFCLRHAALVRVVALAITIPALVLGFSLGRDFMPRLDEGAFLLQTNVPPEASLAEVDRLNHRVEDALRAFPEVEDVVRRTGRAEETEDPMPHTLSDVLVVLKPDRTRTLDELEDAMREALEPILGVSVLFTTPLGMRIDEGLGGTPADLSVRIFGPDFDVLERLAVRAESLIADVPGLTDLRREAATRLPQLRIAIDRQQAARAGLAPGDVVRAVRVGLVGERASEVWVGQRRYDLVVRLQEHHRGSLEALRGLTVTAHDGTPVPLVQLATIEEDLGPAAIRREGGSRRIAIEGSITGRDLASAAAEVRSRLGISGTNASTPTSTSPSNSTTAATNANDTHDANRANGATTATDARDARAASTAATATRDSRGLDLPPGYFVDLGGRVESEARATRSLWTALGIALLAVVVLLYLALDSIADTAVVLLTLPDAFVGAILALWIAGGTWNVSSLVGLIGLLGIAVQNSLVLLTQTRALVAEGKPFDEALRLASIGRVRPKLMTASTAILGLLPILIFRMHGTEIERPLAIVMIGGLITSTLFTLLALPTFCQFVHRQIERRQLTAADHRAATR